MSLITTGMEVAQTAVIPRMALHANGGARISAADNKIISR